MDKRKVKISLVMNSVICILEIIALLLSFRELNLGMLFYYTVLSNTFLLISSILMIISEIRILKGEETGIPLKVSRMKYMATCTVSVTFLVVVFILTPSLTGTAKGKTTLIGSLIYLMGNGSMLYMHFICPVLAFVSYTVFEKPETYSRKLPRLAIIPTLIYAAVLIPLNIIGVIDGPYPFLRVMHNPLYMSLIWIVVILGFAYLIAIMVNVASRKRS